MSQCRIGKAELFKVTGGDGRVFGQRIAQIPVGAQQTDLSLLLVGQLCRQQRTLGKGGRQKGVAVHRHLQLGKGKALKLAGVEHVQIIGQIPTAPKGACLVGVVVARGHQDRTAEGNAQRQHQTLGFGGDGAAVKQIARNEDHVAVLGLRQGKDPPQYVTAPLSQTVRPHGTVAAKGTVQVQVTRM